jgi:ligand-binding SRPBCC domain-containing protein
MAYIHYASVVPIPREKIFEYLKDMRHMGQLLPPGIKLELTGPSLRMQKGAEYEFRLTRFGIRYMWVVRVEEFDEPNSFTERQVLGVFENWVHTYKFEEHGAGSTLVTNIIQYSVPFGLFGKLADDLLIRQDLTQMLRFAHEKLKTPGLLDRVRPVASEELVDR